jgi:hypothetical protein
LIELARFETAARGTALGHRIPVLRVPLADVERLQACRASCCLYYQEPVKADDAMPTWLQGPWERYCTTCPLIPADETIRRLVWRQDHLGQSSGSELT